MVVTDGSVGTSRESTQSFMEVRVDIVRPKFGMQRLRSILFIQFPVSRQSKSLYIPDFFALTAEEEIDDMRPLTKPCRSVSRT